MASPNTSKIPNDKGVSSFPHSPSRNSTRNTSQHAVKSVTSLLEPHRHPSHGLEVVVEGATHVVHRENETFVTQRGGKIIQGVMTGHKNEASTMLENRQTLQSTLLLQKKREMHAIQTLLEKKRVEFSKRMEECREKQEELKAKQKQIRDRVTKFEKFLKENDAKRQRANVKSINEKKLHRHKTYERYLQSIVDSLPPDYLDVNEPHINDIIMRHKTLVETNDDLKSVVQCNQDEVEKLQAKLAGLIKDKNDLILVYNSKLGTQQKYLDKIKQNSAYLEQRIEERDNSSKERMRIISETKLAIDDLYDRIAVRSRVVNVVQSDTVGGEGNDVNVQGPNTVPVTTGVAAIMSMSASTEQKTLTEKLHALQYRVLDMQDITQVAEADRKRQAV
ncbi:hypothetical protein BATDEDRAFT_26838 [Batrachochytrium dendrobatidis JAM81]|uniref:DUF4200 domain-containing protein n=1 Tax=Batrachochytrium dendrobatidis (strain JAM81 / FGSC 10211) TaxID=684364 RepID=F4P944_BATDJ|nr:uncharacterized protein BATDEDRAFT_26838 [Batrachochytrium dendrobatidis JAM81]EGF78277.1 hypothetical protein BATDEDRAFT_26838 [Batrachochytrium dendrobatidis JAM81]|eukprot:XP_006681063.1 hypothetical protein BATDEDRAFT_26838 [Batrachochytrium dendrobatidis JAM81]